MKRSEMLNNIAQIIADFHGFRIEPTYNDKYVAADILKEIEKSGMEPPKHIFIDETGAENSYMARKWEQE